jgi:hypothetical protein
VVDWRLLFLILTFEYKGKEGGDGQGHCTAHVIGVWIAFLCTAFGIGGMGAVYIFFSKGGIWNL